jgi:alpha-L-fucosidase 2
MQHAWDHYEYSQNDTLLKPQDYSLIKGVTEFWSYQLQLHGYFHNGTLVVNPCNSPEHGPTTFACTHYQQLIYQVFKAISSVSSVVGESEATSLNNVTTVLASLDRGLPLGTWGEIKEWKIPDNLGYDFENDTHRRLSLRVGWYPGYPISSFQGGDQNSTIRNAVATSLYSHGLGNGPDANAGWEKVWRSACSLHISNTSTQLRLTLRTTSCPCTRL